MFVTTISQAKAQLSNLVMRAGQGEEILIGKNGQPLAKLVPFKQHQAECAPGALRGKIHMAKDFDDLPDDIAHTFGVNG